MARPADAPGPGAAIPAEPAAPGTSPGHLSAEDLTWHELAEALWLAAVMPSAPGSEPPAAPRTPPGDGEHVTPERAPGAREDTAPDGDGTRAEQPPARPEPEPAPTPPPPERPREEAALPAQAVTGEPAGHGTAASGWQLPDRLDVIRALRPLKRYVASRRVGDVVIDEVATAERAVQDELWWPVTKQRRERWLDLTVVVDAAPTMALWRHKVAAFVELLEQLGAFRMIRVRRLDTNRFSAGVPLPPVLCGATGPRDPAEVVDHSGRGVVLVLTDGLGEAWRSDLIGPVLARWGRAMPVSVVHLLPQWMWGRAGPALHRATLFAAADLRPNRTWSIELPDAWRAREPEHVLPEGVVPVPVLELGPRWLRWWARLMTGGHRAQAHATVLLATDKPRPHVTAYENVRETSSPHSRVAAFRGAASPEAQRFAQLLAALPADLPVAKLVQDEFLPGTGPELMAELVVGGLLRYASRTAPTGSTVDLSEFDIARSDREILLEGARRTETARVVRKAAQHHGHRIGALALLHEAIADPEHAREPAAQADRVLQSLVLRALSGGPYLARAERLAATPGPPADHVPSVDTVPTESPESATMSQAAERARIQHEQAAAVSAPEVDAPEPDTASVTPVVFSPGVGERQPGDPPPIWGTVPPRNLNFTGRADLIDQLHDQLTSGGLTAVLPAALHGMGGIGKTQTAVEYIYRHLDDYDLVWWVPAAQPTQIRSALTDLARQLGLPGSSEAHSAVPAVLEALRRGNPVRRWLLVFDAAESPEAVRKFFPSNGPGEILVTSRNPAWAGVARPLEVSVFRRAESKELLRRRGPDISDDDADRIADKLGDLPLAIEQAAAWRAETGMPVREYLRLFEEKVSEIFDSSAPLDYEVSVAAAWNVSFDELRRRNPAAHQILLICSFFSPDPITRDLFTGVRGVSISPELDVALRDPIQLARAIRDINRYGLAKIDHGNNTIQLHRLVQFVLRNRITTTTLQTQMRHGAHQLLANLDPNDPESGRSWPRYRELLPHAYAAEVVNCTDSWVRQLVINLMRFLFQWGDHDEAANLAQQAYEDFTEKLGPNDPQTLEVALRLGIYLWALGRFAEAAELNQRTLERRVHVSGENSEETFAIQANVLADLKAQGDFGAARRLSEEILHKTSKLLGPDDPETLNAAYRHGISLRLVGDFAAARVLDENTYRKRVEILGRDHPKTLGSFMSVVVDRREAGEYSWARIEYEKLVEQAVERFGMDNRATQIRIHMLSIARRKDGDHAGALELSGPALDHFRHRYGPDHPNTVGCVLAHSIDQRHAGDLTAARLLGENAFDSFRRLLGEHHPHTFAATVDLAVALRLSGEVAAARELDLRALEGLRTGLGADHPNTIVSGINLASDLSALGETDAAIELGRDMCTRATNVLGPDHPTTLAAAVNLVFDMRLAGHDDTETRYSDVMARYRRAFGDSHPGTTAAAKGSRANCDIDPLLL
ncbi:FxSxx-COOH system tetratricopeptide repeat protein [Actinophytocola sp. KF-1]